MNTQVIWSTEHFATVMATYRWIVPILVPLFVLLRRNPNSATTAAPKFLCHLLQLSHLPQAYSRRRGWNFRRPNQVEHSPGWHDLRNQMFGVFIFLFIFPQMMNQIMPMFASHRILYEARERPSKAYSWKAFMFSNVLVELAWGLALSVICFVCWYFPMGLYRNAEWADAIHSRGIAMLLQVMMFFVFASTFSHFLIASISSADVASAIGNLFMILMFAFCGVLATPDALPRFWIFMYRVNPFTYIVGGFLGTSLANAPVTCSTSELITFEAPNNTACGEYLESYMAQAGGYLVDASTSACQFCSMANTNAFLGSINVSFSKRWRDFGIMLGYCIFNIFAAAVLYWTFRVPKQSKKEVKH